MTAEKIRTALQKLDPKQDVHWTKEGEPSVSFVNVYTGTKVNREDISAAWPGFVRSNATQMAADGYKEDAGQPRNENAEKKGATTAADASAVLPGAPAPQNDLTADPANPPAVQVNTDNMNPERAQDAEGSAAGENIPPDLPPDAQPGEKASDVASADNVVIPEQRTEMEELQDELLRIDGYIDMANARKVEINKRIDQIIYDSTSEQMHFSEVNQSYLERQKQERENRAQRLKALNEAGLSPEKLRAMIPQMSPIDLALSSKKRG